MTLPDQTTLDLGPDSIPTRLRDHTDTEHLLRYIGYRHAGPDTGLRHLWVDPQYPISVNVPVGRTTEQLVVSIAGSTWSAHSMREHPISAHLLTTAISEARDYVAEVLNP